MKRITLAALVLLLSSCQTTSFSPPVRDYAALAAAAVAKYTITDNDVYGFEPEGKLDPKLTVLESHPAGGWTVCKVADKKSGFDSVVITVDRAGTIVRLQFFRQSHTSLGWHDFIDSADQDLQSKYRAVQRIGDNDTAELTVYVASDEAEWKQHYIQYLQLMDEPNHLGAQNCWILQPHLSQIRATIKRQGAGAQLVIDFQTKQYAAAQQARAGSAK
ncbi:MAG: hypothetical protein PHE83_06265 [Opitutaceae bacterium]|nr:hypothetical protein [Opitutaceae bacterium]